MDTEVYGLVKVFQVGRSMCPRMLFYLQITGVGNGHNSTSFSIPRKDGRVRLYGLTEIIF